MTRALQIVSSNTTKGFAYIALAIALVVSPLYADMSVVKSMVAFYILYGASAVLAGICLTNSLAHFKVMRQPAWAWDQIFLPICGVLAASWLTL